MFKAVNRFETRRAPSAEPPQLGVTGQALGAVAMFGVLLGVAAYNKAQVIGAHLDELFMNEGTYDTGQN